MQVGRYEILEIIGSGAHGRVARAHDPLIGRLALARPPNLEMQYQRMRKSCQVKNAKCGQTLTCCVYL